ncbi:putative DBH-like monooxygenase protein 1 [Hypsibius exemplaris]|uniref:DBH-like monooxygenase protein 1 n=1 Tax=Hypsibius exemplaris TaxID=2072580 RepID=A0A1W0WBZ0_HYPEX|nr:putative DBH-like monooxygenase protein 1 [Hypsibius exemplaris]
MAFLSRRTALTIKAHLLAGLIAAISAQDYDGSTDTSLSLTHSTFLDGKRDFFLGWRFNATHMDVEITARTRGWIAVGISPNGQMDQSDVLLGWVDDNTNAVTVQDRWNTVDAKTGVNLLLDGKQDWQLVTGFQNDTHTTVRAVRALDTCDPQDRPFTQSTLRIIYAYHTSDPINPQTITKHTQRGVRSVLFHSPSFWINRTDVLNVKPQQRLQQMDIQVDKVSIPASRSTLYWCKLIRLPVIDQKYHIISVKPLIEQGHESLVHHVLVYLCSDRVTDSSSPKEFDCNHEERNEGIEMITGNCQTVLAAWAVGGTDIVYPEEAGMPLTPEMSGRYVQIEIHYNNPPK